MARRKSCLLTLELRPWRYSALLPLFNDRDRLRLRDSWYNDRVRAWLELLLPFDFDFDLDFDLDLDLDRRRLSFDFDDD